MNYKEFSDEIYNLTGIKIRNGKVYDTNFYYLDKRNRGLYNCYLDLEGYEGNIVSQKWFETRNEAYQDAFDKLKRVHLEMKNK